MSEEVQYGQYVLERRLAIGTTGDLFVGRIDQDPGEERVIVKRLHPEHSEDPSYVERFLKEAQLATLLNHDNLIKIHELGNVEGQWCMALDYVEGVSLDEVIAASKHNHKPVPFGIAATWVIAVAKGLHHLHTLKGEMGQPLSAVHRYISPQAVVVTWDGDVKIVDFGFTKIGGTFRSAPTLIMRSGYAYLSPEQVRGDTLDARSDIYALGCVLYELVTGTRTFSEPDVDTLLNALRQALFKPPRELRGDLPDELDGIIDKMLAKDPEERYQDAESLTQDLRSFLDNTTATSSVGAYLTDLFGCEIPGGALDSYINAADQVSVPVGEQLARPDVEVNDTDRALLLAHAEESARRRRPTLKDPVTELPEDLLDGMAETPGEKPDPFASEGTLDIAIDVMLPEETAKGTKELRLRDTTSTDGLKMPMLLARAEHALRHPASLGTGAALLLASILAVLLWWRTDDPPPVVQKKPLAMARMAVSSDPPGALILVNDKTTEAVTPATIELEPGQGYVISARLEGHTAAGVEVEPRAGEELEVAVPLSPDHAPGTGTIVITTEPECEVFVNAKNLGPVPTRIEGLTPGSTVVQLRNPRLGINRHVRIQVRKGETLEHHVALRRGKLTFEVAPWAYVYLDGHMVGTTPMPPVSLYEGVHQIRLINPDLDVRREVRVKVHPSKTTVVSQDLGNTAE